MEHYNYRKKAAWILFVYDHLSAGQISEELNIPLGTVKRWGVLDKWVEHRLNPPQPSPPRPVTPLVEPAITPKVRTPKVATTPIPADVVVVPPPKEPTIDRVEGDEAIAKWQEQALQDERAYTALKNYAEFQIRTLSQEADELQKRKDGTGLRRIASSLPAAKAAAEWGKVLDLAIKGRRLVTSAHYFDLNNAIGLIKQYGYELVAAVPVNQSIDSNSEESAEGISPKTSDRILRECLGIEEDITELSEGMDT